MTDSEMHSVHPEGRGGVFMEFSDENKAIDYIYGKYRYTVPDPYDFAVTHSSLAGDPEELERMALVVRRRHISLLIEDAKGERADLDSRIADLERRLLEINDAPE
ncbi:hypothetical protein ABT282_07175 [Streptomyces sp. NPDC000927]|uniref:hypothetical protein n=1 Tax=Streptomyces sp. NPDC000927 TaxID=3154371 RepID=UPI0033323675